MSYVDQGMTKGRMWAIIMVAILHALIGYAFVTGLAYTVIKTVQEDLKTFDVKEPPPPEEVPPPPEPQEVQPPPVTVPPPIPRPPPITPPPPPPPPPRIEPARARANLASYVSNDDYPASALRNEEEGTAAFRLTVGPDGRVTACTITSSSGSASLDATTCRLMRSRARFTPARDSSGQPVSDTASGRIRWQIQQ